MKSILLIAILLSMPLIGIEAQRIDRTSIKYGGESINVIKTEDFEVYHKKSGETISMRLSHSDNNSYNEYNLTITFQGVDNFSVYEGSAIYFKFKNRTERVLTINEILSDHNSYDVSKISVRIEISEDNMEYISSNELSEIKIFIGGNYLTLKSSTSKINQFFNVSHNLITQERSQKKTKLY